MIETTTAARPAARSGAGQALLRPTLRRRLPARTAAVAGVAAFVLFVVNVQVVSRGEALWDGPVRVAGLALCCLALAVSAWVPRHAVAAAAAGLLAMATTGAFGLFGYLAAMVAIALAGRADRRAGAAGAAALAAFFAVGLAVRDTYGNDTMPAFTDPPGALYLLAGLGLVVVAAGLASRRAVPGPAAPGLAFLGRPPAVTPPEVLLVAVAVAVTALRSAPLFSMPALSLLEESSPTLVSPAGTALLVALFCLVVGGVALAPWFPRAAYGVVLVGLVGEVAFAASGGVLYVPPLTATAVVSLYVLARVLLVGPDVRGPRVGRLVGPLVATTVVSAMLTTADQVAGLLREAALAGAIGTRPMSLDGYLALGLARTVADLFVRSLAGSVVLPVLAVAAAWLVTRWLADRERLATAATREAAAAERSRIARELHDVVAHHVSLVTVRAESAPFLVPDLPGPARDAFGEIARTSRQALDELRDVLQVLGRDGDPELAPQPTLADVPGLVAAARQAGAKVRFDGLPDVPDVPAGSALAAHAVVREGLSNARRHAPGAPVEVAVTVHGDVLVVEVTNPLTTARTGDGLGLAGLRERAAAVGGTLAAGPDGDVFRLRGRLPLHRAGGDAA